MPRRTPSEAAVSDIVGTILLIGIAVTLAALVALQHTSEASAASAPLRVDARATASGNEIQLLHMGGATLDAGELRVLVSANAQLHHEGSAGPGGQMWNTGETLRIPLASPLPAGSAELSIVHAGRGETLALVGVGAARATGAAPATQIVLDIMLDGSPSKPTVVAPTQVLAEATVTHPDGRKLVRTVHVDLSGVDGPVWFSLRDDGTRGDRVPGDGTWSGFVNVPLSAPKGDDTIVFTATDLRGAKGTKTALIHVT